MGGGWKSVSESTEDLKGDSIGAMSLREKPNKEPMKKLKEFVSEMNKADVPAYLRKQKGEKPLTVADVKGPRKDSISHKDNLAKLRGEEVEQIEEGYTLGEKTPNKQGGHNQDVHYNGKKIGHIESYSHRTGTKYGMEHQASGEGTAGSRSHEEALADLKNAHKEHMSSVKEEVEQVEERSMTEPEMKKREEIVKSMKKGMAGFKDRYGDRAKSVMYATATKQAKKD